MTGEPEKHILQRSNTKQRRSRVRNGPLGSRWRTGRLRDAVRVSTLVVRDVKGKER